MRSSKHLHVILIVLLLQGCSGESRSLGSRQEIGSGLENLSTPIDGCVESDVEEAKLYEVAAVVPEDMRSSGPQPQDRGWLPVRLSDVALENGRIATLDGGGHRVAVFSNDFLEREEWGQRGAGPGEFGNPQAIATGEETTWVLDRDPPRITVFEADGSVRLTLPVEGMVADLSVDLNGKAYVSKTVFPPMVKSDPERFGTVVEVLDTTGASAEPWITVGEDLGPPRFVLPGPNEVRVKGMNGRVAVFYPVSGVVDVFQGGSAEKSIATCMPQEWADSYAEQRGSTGGPSGSQRYVNLITDVWLDSDGSVSTVGAVPDSEDRYHIDHFDASGRLVRKTVIPNRPTGLLSEVRFGSDRSSLLAFESTTGLIARYEVRTDS